MDTPPADPLDQALALHRAGDLVRAKTQYIAILRRQPDHFDALHLLGVVALQSQNAAAAVGLIKLAIGLAPDVSDFHSNLALAHKDLAQWDAALASVDQAIRLNPISAQAHFNRGSIFQLLDKPELALACLENATRFMPNYADAHFQMGLTLQQLQRPDVAISSYD